MEIVQGWIIKMNTIIYSVKKERKRSLIKRIFDCVLDRKPVILFDVIGLFDNKVHALNCCKDRTYFIQEIMMINHFRGTKIKEYYPKR